MILACLVLGLPTRSVAIALLPVLVALGFRADGRKDIIDYRLAVVESAS